jgi:hypothetical protein
MAAAKRERNRYETFSTTLPINVDTVHKQAVWARRDKVHTSRPYEQWENKKARAGILRRKVLRVRL